MVVAPVFSVMVTELLEDGGGVVIILFTVTLTADEVVKLELESRAIAVIECEPLVTEVVLQETEYGDVVSSAPTFTPSTLNCTPDTATLSEALAVIFTAPETVAEAAGDVTETVGGVVSPLSSVAL